MCLNPPNPRPGGNATRCVALLPQSVRSPCTPLKNIIRATSAVTRLNDAEDGSASFAARSDRGSNEIDLNYLSIVIAALHRYWTSSPISTRASSIEHTPRIATTISQTHDVEPGNNAATALPAHATTLTRSSSNRTACCCLYTDSRSTSRHPTSSKRRLHKTLTLDCS